MPPKDSAEKAVHEKISKTRYEFPRSDNALGFGK